MSLVAAGIPLVTTVRLISATEELSTEGPLPLERAMHGANLLDPCIADPRWNLPGFSEEIDRRQAEVTREVAHNLRTLHAAGARLFVGTDFRRARRVFRIVAAS